MVCAVSIHRSVTIMADVELWLIGEFQELFFLFLLENTGCGSSLESSQGDDSNEPQQRMFLSGIFFLEKYEKKTSLCGILALVHV